MIVVNFSHPLTASQQHQIESFTGASVTAVYDIPCQFDNTRPFAPQIERLLEKSPLSPEQWQTEALIINPPGLAPAASVLLAELHGRMGYFPAIIRIRPVAGSTPPQFEVAEIINLQTIREQARAQRVAPGRLST